MERFPRREPFLLDFLRVERLFSFALTSACRALLPLRPVFFTAAEKALLCRIRAEALRHFRFCSTLLFFLEHLRLVLRLRDREADRDRDLRAIFFLKFYEVFFFFFFYFHLLQGPQNLSKGGRCVFRFFLLRKHVFFVFVIIVCCFISEFGHRDRNTTKQ